MRLSLHHLVVVIFVSSIVRDTLECIALPRSLLGSLLAVLIATALPSCRRLDSGDASVAPTTGTLASLNGTVTDMASRRPLAGVTVAILGVATTTGPDGFFAFSAVPDGETPVSAQREGLVNFLETVRVTGARTLDIRMKPSNAVRIAGNWIGSWETPSLDRTGDLAMSVLISTVAQSALVAFDVNGNLVDDDDPPGDTFRGTLAADDRIRISQQSPTYGKLTLDITADGRIAGNATDVPIGTATRVDFTGTMSASVADVSYTITYLDATTATGRATFTKIQP